MTTVNKINYLTRNNTYYHGVTTVTTANTPNIKTKIVQYKDQNCPKNGRFVRISGIEECHKWKRNNYEIYFLKLEEQIISLYN